MYLEIVAICCLAIIHSSLCDDDIHNFMSVGEIDMVFQTTIDSVPQHELIPFSNGPTDLYYYQNRRVFKKGQHMWFKTFGTDIHLWLHPIDSFLIRENTPVYHAKYSSDQPANVTFELQPGAMEGIAQLYEDLDHWASLVIGTDASGKTRVNGHIGTHGLTIRSVPDNVVKEYLRKRRSIDEHEYLSSNMSYLVAYPTSKKLGNELTMNALDQTNIRERIDRSIPATEEYIPNTLYPEILVVVENSLYRKLGSNDTTLLEYLIAFWNGVDLLYRNLGRPEIRLCISAIIIGTESAGTPYISDNKNDNGFFNADFVLENAKTFFYKINDTINVNSYDIALTMTAKQFGGRLHRTAKGLASHGGACKLSNDTVEGVSIVYDDGQFSGIHIAAHDLGDNFGMLNDDRPTVNCSRFDGYIMAPNLVVRSKNLWSFSNCSIDTFETLISNGTLSCLENQPENSDYGLPKIMPGKLMNLEQQCKAKGFDGACKKPKTKLCELLACSTDTFCGYSLTRVLEGTACGSPNMFCLRGRCTQIPGLSAEALLHLNWFNRRKNPNGKY